MAAPFVLQRLLFGSALLVGVALGAHAQDLPKKDASGGIDVEPRLMLNDLPDLPALANDPSAPKGAAPSLDVAKLESDLERAKKTAAGRERLFKAGVVSKVEAEQAVLKTVRLAKDLELARLQAVTRDVEAKRAQAEKVAPGGTRSSAIPDPALAAIDNPKASLTDAEAALAAATASAAAASAKWDAARLAAAELRVQRERKLLALGAGSRSLVKRAEAALEAIAPPRKPADP